MVLPQKFPLAQREVNAVRESGAVMPLAGDTSTPPVVRALLDAWRGAYAPGNKKVRVWELLRQSCVKAC